MTTIITTEKQLLEVYGSSRSYENETTYFLDQFAYMPFVHWAPITPRDMTWL